MAGRDPVRGTDFAAMIQAHVDRSHGLSATHDALTGMPNRVLFHTILDEACRTADCGDLALLRVSVDEVANLRADFGQATADAVVTAVAGRLRRSIRTGDVVAKLRDADFALILAADDVAEAACAAQRILDRLREPFEVSGRLIDLTVVIGIAYAGAGRTSAEILLERAEIALERAHATGTVAFRIYKPGSGVDPETQAVMLADLHRALSEGEMSVGYQPIIGLADRRMRAAEAVLQWDHPRIGLINGADFLPVLGDPGSARLLLDWSIGQVCRAVAGNGDGVVVIVTVDPTIVPDEALATCIANTRIAHGIAPGALAIGIPEAAFRTLDHAALASLQAIRAAGTLVVLDDYSGSAISHDIIRTLPIDGIRMAPAVLGELETDITAFVRLQALTGLARNLRITTGAKGCETEEEVATLRRFGFDEVQGPILGGLLSESELIAYSRSTAPFRALPPR